MDRSDLVIGMISSLVHIVSLSVYDLYMIHLTTMYCLVSVLHWSEIEKIITKILLDYSDAIYC